MPLTPITLNAKPHNLYFSAKGVIKANRLLRALERLKSDEDTKTAARLIGGGDLEVLAVYIDIGLEHEPTYNLDADRIAGYLGEVIAKRRDQFFPEIQRPVLDCLKANGHITWSIEPTLPESTNGTAADRPTEVLEN